MLVIRNKASKGVIKSNQIKSNQIKSNQIKLLVIFKFPVQYRNLVCQDKPYINVVMLRMKIKSEIFQQTKFAEI